MSEGRITVQRVSQPLFGSCSLCSHDQQPDELWALGFTVDFALGGSQGQQVRLCDEHLALLRATIDKATEVQP